MKKIPVEILKAYISGSEEYQKSVETVFPEVPWKGVLEKILQRNAFELIRENKSTRDNIYTFSHHGRDFSFRIEIVDRTQNR